MCFILIKYIMDKQTTDKATEKLLFFSGLVQNLFIYIGYNIKNRINIDEIHYKKSQQVTIEFQGEYINETP